MKVAKLIRETEWIPGRHYGESPRPLISVLLPTFRRGKSGLFKRAVQSVLEQTLEEIELIIIDDASSDGTADQIRQFMADDPRVSCLRHPKNIGIPAISEFEAYQRARADFIAFAFDDDLFYPDALEQLLEHSLRNPGKVCFGHVSMRVRESNTSETQLMQLGSPLTSHNLRSWNTISNNSVLLHRDIIEDVGLYDPHIVMTRLCDWDLWRRISDKYLLEHVDVAVGEVGGPATFDSLGKTYHLDTFASEERMRTDRDAALRPSSFADVDILSSESCSSITTLAISESVNSYLAARPWLGESPAAPFPCQEYAVVLTSNHDASTSIYFDYLPEEIRRHVRVIRAPGGFSSLELSEASCLIIVRDLKNQSEWINAAIALKVPLYYFLDDNFPELARSEIPELSEYSAERLRHTLKDFAGVLLSTPALVEYFRDHLIHPKLYLYPVAFKAAAIPAAHAYNEVCTVVSLGGKHRLEGLRNTVLPALVNLARPEQPFHLVVGGCSRDDEKLLSGYSSDALQITCLPFELDWRRSLLAAAAYRPDILVHPPSSTANNKYKTLNIALSAHLLGALLVAPEEEPFDAPEFAGAAMLVPLPQLAKNWLSVLSTAVDNRQQWDRVKSANTAFCATEFSGRVNEKVLKDILAAAPKVGIAAIKQRFKTLASSSQFRGGLNGSQLDSAALKGNLRELSRVRTAAKRRRRIRFRQARDDLWPLVSPAFGEIQKFAQQSRIRRAGISLELSDNLSDLVYLEYPYRMDAGALKSFALAFSSEGVQSGTVGLELAASSGQVLIQTVFDLASVDMQMPVTFDVSGTEVPPDGIVNVRVFARSDWPVYTFEFTRYPLIGWKGTTAGLFAKYDYASGRDIEATLG